MLNKFCKYLGWNQEPIQEVGYPDTFNFTDHLELKLQYLKEANHQEDDRLETLESKTSLLTGQTGIIFSLIGLFIPLYLDKFSTVPGWLKYGTVSIFVLTLGFYLNTILQSIRSLNIVKFGYARRSTGTAKHQYLDENDIRLEEVKDLIHCIERNAALNEYKANGLIASYRSFRIGNIGIGILSFLILLSLMFTKEKKNTEVQIIQPVQIREWDKLIEEVSKLQTSRMQQHEIDTLKIKIVPVPDHNSKTPK